MTNTSPVIMLVLDSEQQGVIKRITCPLMIKIPGRFPLSVCQCDIPQTREWFLQQVPSILCADSEGETCLPRMSYPEKVGEEVNAPPKPPARRPRGSWTASFRKPP